MTETEWLGCTDPTPMFEFLRGKASDRKLRLFACACFKGSSNLPNDKRCQIALSVLERRAEGQDSIEERNRAGQGAREVHHEIEATVRDGQSRDRSFAALVLYRLLVASNASFAAQDASSATRSVLHNNGGTDAQVAAQDDGGEHCRLTREIFGNPFRPVTISPSCLTWNDAYYF